MTNIETQNKVAVVIRKLRMIKERTQKHLESLLYKKGGKLYWQALHIYSEKYSWYIHLSPRLETHLILSGSISYQVSIKCFIIFFNS